MKRLLLLLLMSVECCLPSAAFPQTGETATDVFAKRVQVALLNPPVKVSNASVGVSGNPGPATYFYWIVTNTAVGASSPAGPFTATSAPNTLSGSNFDQISWTSVAGAVSYDVLRTATPAPPFGVCNCAVATAVAGNSVNDQSNSLLGYTVAPLDPATLVFTITNESQAPGVSNLVFRSSGNAVLTLPSNGTLTFAQAFAPVVHQFLTGMSAGGVFSAAQPASADISDGTGTGVVARQTNAALVAPTFDSENNFAVIHLGIGQYSTWSLGLAACPAAPSGCILDATSPSAPLAMGTFDPGTKTVAAIFGPFPFTATQITARTNLYMGGAGNKVQTGLGATTITSVGGNATPLIVIPQASNTPAQGVQISGIQFIGASGNTSQKGLFADASTLTNAGLWYSKLTNVDFTGFAGPSIHLKGRPDNATSVNQFIELNNVHAFRVAGGDAPLRIENGVGQVEITGTSEFDGPGINDVTAPNIFVGELLGTDTQSPYSIHFSGLTCQSSNLCMQISGVQGLVIDGTCHFENLHGGIQGSIVGTTDNVNVVIEGCQFFGTVGVNAGNGFLLKNNSGNPQATFKFCANQVGGTPDKIIAGTNGNTIAVCDNHQSTSPPTWTSSGITTQMNPAATLNIGGYHTVALNNSATNITTLQSSLGPGEMVTFLCLASSCIFATGGNLNLGTLASPVSLAGGQNITFVRNDLTGTAWHLVAKSN